MTTEETEATMPTERITLERARDLLARAVGTQGRDFIYNPGGQGTCHYTPLPQTVTDDPRRLTGCLIGVALDLAGFTGHRGIQGRVSVVHSRFPDLMTLAARDYFSAAQRSQDGGSTWGSAYDKAEARIVALIQRHGRRNA